MFYRCIVLIIIVLLVGCKSSERVRKKVDSNALESISENKLFKEIVEHELKYNTINVKKVDVLVNLGEEKQNIKGSLRIQRDSFVWLSFNAMLGIEIARFLFTKDSIKFMSPYLKGYYITDYQTISEKIGIDVSYPYIENVLTNQFIDLQNGYTSENSKNSKFRLQKDTNEYRLSNIKKQELNRKLRRYIKKKKKNKDYAILLQKIAIDPIIYKPLSISIEDIEDEWKINVKYSNFENIKEQIMPVKLYLDIIFDYKHYNIEFKYSKIEFDVEISNSFKIPSRYKKLTF